MSKLPDKIHYQIFDSLGKVERVLVDNDAQESTGNTHTDNAGQEAKGIDSIMGYKYNLKGEKIQIDYNLDASKDNSIEKSEYFMLNANGYTEMIYSNLDGKATGQQFTVNAEKVSGIDKVEKRVLDSQGRWTERFVDDDAILVDGENSKAYNYREQRILDSNGYVSEMRMDMTNDGDFERKQVYKNNASGKQEEVLAYNNIKEVPDNINQRTVYERDSNGYITKETTYINNSPTASRVNVKEVDALGRPTLVYYDNDGDANGYNPVRVERLSYNSQNQVEKKEIFEGATVKDTADSIENYTYYPNGKLHKIIIGNSEEVREYNALGYNTKTSSYTLGNDKPNKVITREFDANGNTIFRQDDGQNIGVNNDPNDVTYRYSYDLANRIHTETATRGTNNPIDVVRLEFDGQNRATKLLFDHNRNYATTNAPDSTDAIETFTYHPIHVNAQSTVVRTDHLNNPIYSLEYEYDSSARILHTFYNGSYNGIDQDRNDDKFGRIIIGQTFGRNAIDGYEMNLTQWDQAKTARFELKSILMGDASADTTVVLDKATLARLKGENVRILGDNVNDGDTVKLKLGDFTKGSDAERRVDNEGTYDKYTADVDGTSYTLWIDVDVKVETFA